MNRTCPQCNLEGAYYVTSDDNGHHYECPDCDYEWVESEEGDDSDSSDEEE